MVQKYTFWGNEKLFLQKVQNFFEILFPFYVYWPPESVSTAIFKHFLALFADR